MSRMLVTGGIGINVRGFPHRILKYAYHKILKIPITKFIKFFDKKDQVIIGKPYLTFCVPVDLIKYKVESPLRPPLNRNFLGYKIRAVGIIDGGDWDLHLVKFSDEPIYSCLKERFIEGKEWEDTPYYEFTEEFNEGKEVLNCKTWEEYKEKRLKFFDELYQDMKINGYKRQNNPEDEVQVAVSRDGQVLFIDGHHRLSIAKILKIKEIPVIVNVWHKQYIESVKIIKKNKNVNAHEAFDSIGIVNGNAAKPG